MNILLINPGNEPGAVQYNFPKMVPISLLFLASYLHTHHIKTKILDLSVCPSPKQELKDYLKTNHFDMVGFSGKTEGRFLTWDLIQLTKTLLPKVFIVVGGDFFTFTANQSLKTIKEIDVLVRDEGEITLLELVEALKNKKDFHSIQGISYRDHQTNEIIHNPPRPIEKDLDQFTISDDICDDVILPGDQYSPFMFLRHFEKEKLKAIPIQVGRGCPGRCVFCMYHKKKYRSRTVDSVIAEIKQKKEKYQCHTFHLQDPHLVKNIGFVREFCHRLLNENINIKWYAESRVDINHDLLVLMHRAGCISMDFGMESANDTVLAALKKGISIQQVRDVIHLCARLGIRVNLFSMFSLPDETEKEARETLSFIKENHLIITSIGCACAIIYPGSDLEVMAKERGIIAKDFNWYDRSYKNDWADFNLPTVPSWKEHLSYRFLRDYRDEVGEIFQKRASIKMPETLLLAITFINHCLKNNVLHQGLEKAEPIYFETIKNTLNQIATNKDEREAIHAPTIQEHELEQILLTRDLNLIPLTDRINFLILLIVYYCLLVKMEKIQEHHEIKKRLLKKLYSQVPIDFVTDLIGRMIKLDVIEVAVGIMPLLPGNETLALLLFYGMGYIENEKCHPEDAYQWRVKAIELAQNAADITIPHVVSCLFHVGRYDLENNRKELARERLGRCLQLNPDHAQARVLFECL